MNTGTQQEMDRLKAIIQADKEQRRLERAARLQARVERIEARNAKKAELAEARTAKKAEAQEAAARRAEARAIIKADKERRRAERDARLQAKAELVAAKNAMKAETQEEANRRAEAREILRAEREKRRAAADEKLAAKIAKIEADRVANQVFEEKVASGIEIVKAWRAAENVSWTGDSYKLREVSGLGTSFNHEEIAEIARRVGASKVRRKSAWYIVTF